MVIFIKSKNMEDYMSQFSKAPSDKKTMLVSYAHYEARALKSALFKKEILKLRSYMYKEFDTCRNIYGLIAENSNSARAIGLIQRCAPLIYPLKGVKSITSPTKAFTQNYIAFELENDDNSSSVYRLYYSALELLFMRASVEELGAIIAFLVDDTRKLEKFNFETWKFKKLNFVENFEH